MCVSVRVCVCVCARACVYVAPSLLGARRCAFLNLSPDAEGTRHCMFYRLLSTLRQNELKHHIRMSSRFNYTPRRHRKTAYQNPLSTTVHGSAHYSGSGVSIMGGAVGLIHMLYLGGWSPDNSGVIFTSSSRWRPLPLPSLRCLAVSATTTARVTPASSTATETRRANRTPCHGVCLG